MPPRQGLSGWHMIRSFSLRNAKDHNHVRNTAPPPSTGRVPAAVVPKPTTFGAAGQNPVTATGVFQRFARTAFSPRYLLVTNISICMGLSSLGDALQQRCRYLFSKSGAVEELPCSRTESNSSTSSDSHCESSAVPLSLRDLKVTESQLHAGPNNHASGDKNLAAEPETSMPNENRTKLQESIESSESSKNTTHSSSGYLHDWRRTINILVSAVPMGVVVHYWYLWIDRRFVGRTLRTLCVKTALDQLLFSPVMWLVYLGCLSLLDAATGGRVYHQAISAGAQIYLAEWVVWPPAQFFNFYFLPTRFRVLYDNFISLGFDWYSSYLIFDRNYDD